MSRSTFFRLICAAVIGSGLWAAQAHSESGLPNALAGTRLAALQERDPDTGNTSVPCGADGVCNAGACSHDPDCPSTGTTTAPSGPGLSSTEVTDCGAGQALEMREAVGWGAANWNAFEKAMESFDGWPVNIKSCLENRFKDNGKVVCETSPNGSCKGNNGWASPFNKKCHLCPLFVNKVKGMSGPTNKDNREACYFAILTHEWGHTCERTHKTVEIMDNVAFDFYKSNHPGVTISIGDCGMD